MRLVKKLGTFLLVVTGCFFGIWLLKKVAAYFSGFIHSQQENAAMFGNDLYQVWFGGNTTQTIMSIVGLIVAAGFIIWGITQVMEARRLENDPYDPPENNAHLGGSSPLPVDGGGGRATQPSGTSGGFGGGVQLGWVANLPPREGEAMGSRVVAQVLSDGRNGPFTVPESAGEVRQTDQIYATRALEAASHGDGHDHYSNNPFADNDQDGTPNFADSDPNDQSES